MRRAALAGVIAMLAACGGEREALRTPLPKGVIVLGVDGMDPKLLRRVMAEGRAPNLARLAKEGAFLELGTANPPQSPVAWSMFMTGTNPHHHGIYDFVHRDPVAMAPYLSTSKAEPAEWVIALGDFAIPIDSGTMELLRGGRPFWDHLTAAGVPATIVKVPAEFPPSHGSAAEVLSGMGTPDLLGTYGTFHVVTTDQRWASKRTPSGGTVDVTIRDGQLVRGTLVGPPNAWSASGEPVTLPIDIVVDEKRPVALVSIGASQVILQPGEWSHWVPVAFDQGVIGGEIPGMVRLYLKSIEPEVFLYLSPTNIDPRDPAMPISSPESYARGLAEEAGPFYTQGMPEDTKALTADVLSDAEFVTQAGLVWDESVRMLHRELDRFQGGVLFFYFSSVDQQSHMMWRHLDGDGPFADVLPALYEQVDGAVGEVLERAGPDTLVLVMSDHGFGPYTYKVHLNTWLAHEGYLVTRPPGQRGDGALGHIDWSQTQVYALGLNQLFINQRGREADGIVPESDREALLDSLEQQLLGWVDPETGQRVVTRVWRPERGAYPERAPDIVVGYNRGYRSSDESATGQVGTVVIERNRGKWSGDHCVDPAHAPGVLLSTVPLARPQASLLDLAPTVLGYFDIPAPAYMEGVDLFRNE